MHFVSELQFSLLLFKWNRTGMKLLKEESEFDEYLMNVRQGLPFLKFCHLFGPNRNDYLEPAWLFDAIWCQMRILMCIPRNYEEHKKTQLNKSSSNSLLKTVPYILLRWHYILTETIHFPNNQIPGQLIFLKNVIRLINLFFKFDCDFT